MIEHFGKFMYRIPSFSYDLLDQSNIERELDSFLMKFFSNENFLAAMYIASKDFYNEILKFKKNEFFSVKGKRKFRDTSIKYISRMCTRATPFGFFSGCGIGNIGVDQDCIDPIDGLSAKIRLDAGFLTSIVENFMRIKNARKYLKFFKNNTVYSVGNKCRYVEYYIKNGERFYSLSSFDRNDFLDAILQRAEHGCNYLDVATAYRSDFSEDEIVEYLNELVEAKILISEFEPFVVGSEYEDQVFEVFDRMMSIEIDDEDVKNLVGTIYEKLSKYRQMINRVEAENRILEIQEIVSLSDNLREIPILYQVKDIIQADCISRNNKAGISKSTLASIIDGIETISRFLSTSKSRLDDFKTLFVKRYENQIVPLCEVLDPEMGIGYGIKKNELLDYAPFVDSMPIGRQAQKRDETTLIWKNDFHGMIFKKITEAQKIANNSGSIEITDRETELFPKQMTKLPPTFNAVVSIHNDSSGKQWIEFKRVGSSSAACLLGRFGFMSPEINSVLKEIACYESEYYEHKIVAEINHLSDSRMANVIQRPKFRDFEICYLTKSNSTELGQIEVSDLYITYANGKFQLFSKKLGKRIVPRLSNAHNFYKDTLPLYKFLSDFQDSEIEGGYAPLAIDIAPMATLFSYIPRITYKNCILYPAHWTVKSEEFKRILGEKEDDSILQQNFISFFEKKRIPRRFFYIEGDYEIFVDLDNLLSCNNFIDAIKAKSLIVVKECMQIEGTSLARNSSGNFFHEIVLPLKKNEKNDLKDDITAVNIAVDNLNLSLESSVQRVFCPGSDWVYFKIYAGVKVCEDILQSEIPVAIEYLRSKELISNWFFIRYDDDGFHLRVRFHLTDASFCGEVINYFSGLFIKRIENGSLKNICIDTYVRELERYGHRFIEKAEQIFSYDSDFVISLLQNVKAARLSEHRWLFGLAIMHMYINAFGFSDKKAYFFVKLGRDNFGKEFNSDKMQRRYFTTKYRSEKEKIDAFLTDGIIDGQQQAWFTNLLISSKQKLSDAYNKWYSAIDQITLQNYLSSFIHMFNNRFFSSKNRMHEYSLYFLLEQHFRYQLGKNLNLSEVEK